METQTRNILVIEDSPDVLKAITEILEYSGYQPQGMTRADDQILQQLQADRLGLIILDIMLSGADGRHLAARLKSNENTSGIPILMISAFPGMAPSAARAGADDFLEKPFGIDELIQKVDQFLANGTQ